MKESEVQVTKSEVLVRVTVGRYLAEGDNLRHGVESGIGAKGEKRREQESLGMMEKLGDSGSHAGT